MSGDNLSGLEIRNHTDTKAYKDIRVSSKDRFEGTPYDFTANLGNASELDRIVEMHLLAVSIPNIAYNVSAALGNNAFTSTSSVDGPISVLFADGFYTTDQIIARLESEINLVLTTATITIAQNAFNKKLSFTLSSGTMSYDSTGLNNTIGITEPIPLVGATSAQALPALNGSTMFYIHSQDLATNKTYLLTDGNIRDVNGAFSIPVDVPFGVYQEYQPTELDRHVYGRFGKSLKNFKIVIRTNEGRLYTELTDNFDVVLTLRLYWHTE
jgi:hypothetical protein